MKNKHNAGKSVQNFSEVTSANIPRSTFYRNNTLLTTFDAGKLVPIYIDEVLPGDTFSLNLSHVSRLITPLVPTMDSIDLEFFAFFVPNRLVYENWVEVMGENRDDAWTPASAAHGVPQYGVDITTLDVQSEGKLGDYYGIPVGMDPDNHPYNVLPFRGYALIWNEWFRNQNVQAPLAVEISDTISYYNANGLGPNGDLLAVNKPFDYFTACLPEPQRGESSLIPINLTELIPVVTNALPAISGSGHEKLQFIKTNGSAVLSKQLVVGNNSELETDNTAVGTLAGDYPIPENLWADASGLTVNDTTISDLRTAFQIQRLYERDARGGTRYVEMLKAHFGVNSGDYRLQRPEYLGHQRHTMGVYQVPQTSATGLTGGSTELGGLAAYAHSQGQGHLFTNDFVNK